MMKSTLRASRMARSTKVGLALIAVVLVGAGVIGTTTTAAPSSRRVIIAFKPGASSRVKAAVIAVHGEVKSDVFGMDAFAAEVPSKALKALKKNPDVEYIENDVTRVPFSVPATGPAKPPASSKPPGDSGQPAKAQ